MELKQLLQKIPELNAPIAKAEARLRSAEKRYRYMLKLFDTEVEKVRDILRPHIENAARAYNDQHHLRIDIQSIGIGFHIEKHTCSLNAKLQDAQGEEPREWFDIEDLTALNQEFAALVNPRLAKLDPPFTFGTFVVPTYYYTK